jgi:hypothetical protein
MRRRELIAAARRRGPLVGPVQEPVHLQVGERAGVGERPRELGHPVGDPAEAADDADALGDEAVEIGHRRRGGSG